jgi:type I restriction enzyme S subunit
MKWPQALFGQVAEVVTGNTPPKKDPENYGPGVPWVKPPDLDGWAPITSTAETLSEKGQNLARLLPKETVMVCCIGSVGRVGIAGTTVATNQQINSLVFGPAVNARFGYYYCRSIRNVLQSAARQAVVPILNKSDFAKISMPVPPLSEQQKIVEILDQADELRRKSSIAYANATRILPAVFNKLIGDPATNPKRWPTVFLEDVVEIGSEFVDPNNPSYLDLPHIGGEQIEKETGRILSPSSVRESDLRSGKFLFTPEHILYSKIRPYLNKVAYPRFRGVCSADIYPLRLKTKRLMPWYLVALLRSRAFLDYALLHSGRLRMPKLNREQLGAFTVPIPEPRVVELFERIAVQMEQLDGQSQHVLGTVERIFDVLLSRALSGKLTEKWRAAKMTKLLAEMREQAKFLHVPKEALLC